MDRFTSQDSSDFQLGTINIDLKFTAGTSGAVPASLTVSDGIASVVKSTNAYVVTLQDTYYRFLNATVNVVQATPAAGGACLYSITHDVTNGTTPTITVQPRSADGSYTAVALASGDVITCTFRLARMSTEGN